MQPKLKPAFKSKVCVWKTVCLTFTIFLCAVLNNYCIATPIHFETFPRLFPYLSDEVIDLSSRSGAEVFRNVNVQIKNKKYNTVKKNAQDYIVLHPKSGLGHEVLGTALFMLGLDQEAANAFKKACNLEPRQSGSFAKLGIIQMKDGQTESAQANLKKAVKNNPNNRIAHQHLGLIFEYKKDYPKAVEHFRKGLEGTHPSYLGVSVNLSSILNKTSRYKETIQILSQRLPVSSKVFEAHMILATALYKDKQFGKAQFRFERALELKPENPEARLGIGMSLRGSGDAHAALEQIRPLINEKPDWRAAIMEYGDTLLELNRFQDAKEMFDKGIRLGSNPVNVQKKFAVYYLEQNNFTEAENIYDELIASGNADIEVYIKRAELFQSKGKHEEGISTLKKGLLKSPKNGYLLFRLGAYLSSIKRYDDAVPVLKHSLEIFPDDPTILRFLCVSQAKAGQESDSLESAERLYKLQPNNVNTAILYATRLQANSNSQMAEKIYRQILISAPGNVIVLNNLADLLSSTDRLKEAEVIARQLNDKTQEKNGIFLDTLGWILYRQKRFADALHILEAAREKTPNIPVIHFHLGMTLAASGDNDAAKQVLTHALSISSDAEWANEAKKTIENI